MRINEVFNALVPGFVLANVHFYVVKLVREKNIYLVVCVFVCLLLLLVYTYLEKNFKKLHWYKSGKIGFSGLVTFAVFFLINSIVAYTAPSMVFFTGKISVIISLAIALGSILGLIALSKKIS